MSELEILGNQQLDTVYGGTGPDELMDTSYTHQVTIEEIKTMAKGTYLLVIENGYQHIGKLNLFTQVTSNNNSIYIDVKVEQVSAGMEYRLGNVVSFQFCLVTVYSK